MKIHADKSEAAPKLGLTAAQTRRLLALVPAEWLTDVDEVHISSSLVPSNSRCRPGNASFSPYDRRLTIFARGGTPELLITPILCALAAHHLELPIRRSNDWLSDADFKKVSKLVSPHAEHILQVLKCTPGFVRRSS